MDGSLHVVQGFTVTVADTVGAGDAFAAGFLHGLDSGWPVERIACFANALGAIVASRPGATPSLDLGGGGSDHSFPTGRLLSVLTKHSVFEYTTTLRQVRMQ